MTVNNKEAMFIDWPNNLLVYTRSNKFSVILHDTYQLLYVGECKEIGKGNFRFDDGMPMMAASVYLKTYPLNS